MKTRAKPVWRLVLSFIALRSCAAFYLPGLAPVSFCEEGTSGDECQSTIQLFVNRLDSVESVLPYEYDVFDFCQDAEEKRPSENLGQVLFGERIETSPYKFNFNKNLTCEKVCTRTYDISAKDDKKKLDFLKSGMQLNYQHHWIIDNMPVTWCYNSAFNKKNMYYLFNHVDIMITYHSGATEGWKGARLVGATLEPKSIKHEDENKLTCDGPPMEIPNEFTSNTKVTYSYSVKFVVSLWFTLMCAFGDILLGNDQVNGLSQEESGWKQVHGDVFRPPRKGMLLSVFLGQGTQIFIMTFTTLFLACLGFLSPANRGALMTCAVVLWVLLGTPAGYVSARLYKTFGGEKWKTNVLLTALLCPGIVFADFFLMNLILWVEGSSAAIPFGTLVAILALWFGISMPLTFIGAYFGFKKPQPVRTNQIPRQIPEQSFFTKPIPGIIMGGILPFGCIFIQLFFILNSIWSHQMYYMFGFLFLVFIILLITCSEATILLCYFHLCAEDYHWWWRSFLTSGFTAVYLFIYAVHYFFSKLQIVGAASTILYFGYTMIMVLIFFLFTGEWRTKYSPSTYGIVLSEFHIAWP
uniref:Transmembrane 9 superfamily member n=1 Tax=Denticeps clupeoides TaxID=299321 RepID=A0AAY4CPQ0_9TELE